MFLKYILMENTHHGGESHVLNYIIYGYVAISTQPHRNIFNSNAIRFKGLMTKTLWECMKIK